MASKTPVDAEAFEREALPHLDAVYRFALRLTGSTDQAQDLTQETFLKAFRAWHQYTPGTRAKSWLFTICRNVFLRQWQRGQRHEEIVRELQDDGSTSGPVSVVNPIWSATAESDPEGRFFRTLVEEEVLRHIDALPDRYRIVVQLSDMEELSYQEIAALLDIPVGTVKSRLFRGRRELQDKLFDYAVEMGYIDASRDTEGAASPVATDENPSREDLG